MDELVLTPWRRAGKDRLYVNRVGERGNSLAWYDRLTDEVHILRPEFEAVARAKIEEWKRSQSPAALPRRRPHRLFRLGLLPLRHVRASRPFHR